MKKNSKILFVIIIVLLITILSYLFITDNKTNSTKNEIISLKDDFYESINYNLLASKEIPKDRVGWGTLTDINYEIQDEENDMVREIIKDKNNNINMNVYYHNLLNQDARNNLGFEPIKKYMDKIDSASNINELLDTLYELDNEIGLGSIFNIELSKDYKDKSKKVLSIGSIESDCAIFSEPSYSMVIEIVKQLYKDLLIEYGYDESEASKLVNEYFELENSACTKSLSITELQDIDIIYNLYSLEEVKQIYSNIDIEKYLKDYHLDEVNSFVLMSEKTAKEYNKLFIDENLEMFKTRAKINALEKFYNSLTPSLEKKYIKANNILNGIKQNKTDEEIAVENTRIMFSDIIEKKFVDKHKDEMKPNIELTKQVINDIKEEYYNNIRNVSWLSDETKQNAIKKLDNLTINVGYPENFDINSNDYNFKSYEEGSNLVENVINAYQIKHKYTIDKFFNNQENRTWDFYVDEANAYYKADDNSINVPIGILFLLNDNADYYEILGTIGSIVGHEITHAFDFSGSKFDEKGNYINWWTAEDLEKFNQKKQEVIEYYKNFKYDGKELNTELKSGENMADLGSLETILNMLNKRSVTTDEYKKFFENYAYLWASEYTNQYMLNNMLNDTHSPDKIRVNAVLSNLDKFYEIYDIQSGDGMYINPNERIHIWTNDITTEQ